MTKTSNTDRKVDRTLTYMFMTDQKLDDLKREFNIKVIPNFVGGCVMCSGKDVEKFIDRAYELGRQNILVELNIKQFEENFDPKTN